MATLQFDMPTYALQQDANKSHSLYVEGTMHTAWSGKKTYATADGDDLVYEFDLFTLPAGRLLIHTDLSKIRTTQYEANTDLHLGFRAYKDMTGATVAQDDNYFMDNVDVGGGAIVGNWSAISGATATGVGTIELSSSSGITLYVTLDTADIEDTDTLEVLCIYSVIG